MRYAILVLFLLFPTVTTAQEFEKGPNIDQDRQDESADGFKITKSGEKKPLKYNITMEELRRVIAKRNGRHPFKEKKHPFVGIIGPRADLSDAALSGANLHDVSLTRANLTNAKLVGCNLHSADFTQANLQGAILSGATLFYADLSGANISGAILKKIEYRYDHAYRMERLSPNFGLKSLGPISWKTLNEVIQMPKDKHGKSSTTWDGAWYYEDDPPILPRDFPEELKNKMKVVKRKEKNKE